MPLSQSNKSIFEVQHFDTNPARVIHGTPRVGNLPVIGGNQFTDADIRDICGAVGGSTITYKVETAQRNLGSDIVPPGLYFRVTHPRYIGHANEIGLYLKAPGVYAIYIKDVDLLTVAPKGMGAIVLAKIVRFCLRNNISTIRLLGAGGRLWPDKTAGARWWGYYAWARYGFDMKLLKNDLDLMRGFPNFPWNLSACTTVQAVVQDIAGREWWKTCGNGWFMEFDCSSSASIGCVTLENYLAELNI